MYPCECRGDPTPVTQHKMELPQRSRPQINHDVLHIKRSCASKHSLAAHVQEATDVFFSRKSAVPIVLARQILA